MKILWSTCLKILHKIVSIVWLLFNSFYFVLERGSRWPRVVLSSQSSRLCPWGRADRCNHQTRHPWASAVILSFDLIAAHICVFQFQSGPWNPNKNTSSSTPPNHFWSLLSVYSENILYLGWPSLGRSSSWQQRVFLNTLLLSFLVIFCILVAA